MKKALLASIQDLNPQTSWVKDPSGRHTNLTAVLDWPESDDSDAELTNEESDSMPLPAGLLNQCLLARIFYLIYVLT